MLLPMAITYPDIPSGVTGLPATADHGFFCRLVAAAAVKAVTAGLGDTVRVPMAPGCLMSSGRKPAMAAGFLLLEVAVVGVCWVVCWDDASLVVPGNLDLLRPVSLLPLDTTLE